MRDENAIYGGEMSGHHYFRDFYFCDSGMIPWLIMINLISKSNSKLSALIKRSSSAFPSSGERNFVVENVRKVIKSVEKNYESIALKIEKLDGISFSFQDWRFNIRPSNTEPLLRLNVESKGNPSLVEEKVKEIELLLFNSCD